MTITIEEVIKQYTPLVRGIAYDILKKLPKSFWGDHEDLISMGFIGLLDAHRLRSEHKTPGEFVNYARIRIRGEIYDQLIRPGIDKSKDNKTLKYQPINEYRQQSLDTFIENSDTPRRIPNAIIDWNTPECLYESKQAYDKIQRGMQLVLSERDRNIVNAKIVDEKTYAEISLKEGICFSNVSQRFHRSIVKLTEFCYRA